MAVSVSTAKNPSFGLITRDAAFEKLLAQHQDALVHYISRYATEREDVLDLAQEVFLRAYEARDTILGSNAKGWLYRIATHVIFDFLQRQDRRKEISFGERHYALIDETRIIPPSADAVSALGEKIETESVVMRTVRRLKPIYQSVLILFYYDGFSTKEISRLYALPLRTVKAYLRKARKSLKTLLIENGFRQKDDDEQELSLT